MVILVYIVTDCVVNLFVLVSVNVKYTNFIIHASSTLYIW